MLAKEPPFKKTDTLRSPPRTNPRVGSGVCNDDFRELARTDAPGVETIRMTVDILQVERLSKRFGDTPVLENIGLSVARHSVVGIVGENGAGKSTLFNVISGIVRPDRGRILYQGKEIRPANYREANLMGISRVFQEQALIPNIAVYENILLSHEAAFTRFGQVLDRPRMIEVAQRIVDSMKLDIDVRRRTDDYDFSKRQSIEIARACLVPREVLSIPVPLVLLDEPTSALEKSEEEAFFRLVVSIKQYGSALFVSHRLSEVLRICDLVHVLKDGRLVASVDPVVTDERTLHGLMVGRERDADYYHEDEQEPVAERPIMLSVSGLSLPDHYQDVSLQVRAGEILGIGGLVDSGKSRLGKSIAGLLPPASGTVRLGEDQPAPPSFRSLIARGLAYLPGERLAEGIIAGFSVAWNTSLASGHDIFSNRFGIWRDAVEDKLTRRYIRELNIKTASPRVACATLSGGNQQKVVLAKWLCREPRVVILDNPTRGIDAGAKEEVYKLIRQITAAGVCIILITDELLELIGLSHRIAVMRRGRLTAILDAPLGRKPSEEELVALMLAA
jgi:ribose transport system ATP-binding protein